MSINNISGNSGLRSQESGGFAGGSDPLKGLEERVNQTLSMITSNSPADQPAAQGFSIDDKVSFSPDVLARTFGQNMPGQNVYSLC